MRFAFIAAIAGLVAAAPVVDYTALSQMIEASDIAQMPKPLRWYFCHTPDPFDRAAGKKIFHVDCDGGSSKGGKN